LFQYDLIHPPVFVGLANFTRALNYDLFWKALRNAFNYTIGYVALCLVFGFLLALLLNRPFRGIALFRALYLSPLVVSLVGIAWIFQTLLDKWGPITALYTSLGLPYINFYTDPHWTMPAVIIMTSWRVVGFYMIMFLAALQAINPELYEAARIDGASYWRSVWHITIPLVQPTILFLSMIGVIDGLQLFDQVYVIAAFPFSDQPLLGPEKSLAAPVGLIYNTGFRYFQMGYASALSVLLFVIILVFSLVQARVGRLEARQ
jgi:multiple sugar transport system permease protein